MSFLTVLPLAIVMVAGPQILSAIFLATSERWRENSALFVVGAGLSITAVMTAAFLLSDGAIRSGATNDTLDYVILVLLLAAMIHTYRTRKESEPPKWMGKLENASPRFSFRLGFLLLGFFPTDIITSVSVGGYLSANDLPWTDGLPFLFVTLLLLALPSLTLVAFGKRAEAFLPRARDWMNENSWIVNEVVLLFFVGIIVNGLVG